MTRLLTLLAFLFALLGARVAAAHHVPGHGSSEGVRSINSLGNRGGKAGTRVLLLDEFGWQPTARTPGLRNELSLLGEYAPVPAFSFGAQFPFSVVDEVGRPPVAGYGDTRAFVRFTPHADKLIHRTLTLCAPRVGRASIYASRARLARWRWAPARSTSMSAGR
jgi:hypothetical protein